MSYSRGLGKAAAAMGMVDKGCLLTYMEGVLMTRVPDMSTFFLGLARIPLWEGLNLPPDVSKVLLGLVGLVEEVFSLFPEVSRVFFGLDGLFEEVLNLFPEVSSVRFGLV